MDNIFEYEDNGGELTIIRLKQGVKATSIIIPEKIDGKTVSYIGNFAFSGSNIKKVTISENIKRVGKEAFSGCNQLFSAIWKAKCEIPEECFSYCSKLSRFSFANAEAIGKKAFAKSGLRSITLHKNIKKVETCAFGGCENLEKVVWRAQANIIPSSCFSRCSKLSIFDCENLESIGAHAFKECNLIVVHLPQNTKRVEIGAFQNCKRLENIIWNEKTYKVPENCFENCIKLSAFDFSNIKVIKSNAFRKTGLKKIKLPPNVEKVESYAFQCCLKLEEVIWNAQFGAIPQNCFHACHALVKFDFSNIEIIEKDAFAFSGLKEIILPQNIKSISPFAFYSCEELRSVVWNANYNIIPPTCFGNCISLESFDFLNIEIIESCAFVGAALKKIKLSQSVKTINIDAFADCTELQLVVWEAQCNSIPAECFLNCQKLSAFNFLNIKEIGRRAFYNSGIKAICLESETTVETECFACCHSLEKVQWLPDSAIKSAVFEDCSNLKEVIISDKVNNIAVDAFKGCPNVEFTFV